MLPAENQQRNDKEYTDAITKLLRFREYMKVRLPNSTGNGTGRLFQGFPGHLMSAPSNK